MLKGIWRNIIEFFAGLIEYMRQRKDLFERVEKAESKAQSFKAELEKFISNHEFELKAEMSTKTRVWLKENADNEGELIKIVAMTSEALSQIPKKKISVEKSDFVRDYRELSDHKGLSKSISR